MTGFEIVAAGVLVVGCGLALLGSIGIVRFPGTFARMHAATKPPTLGLLCVAAAVALAARDVEDTAFVALVVALQFLTAPVGAHLLARATRSVSDGDHDDSDRTDP